MKQIQKMQPISVSKIDKKGESEKRISENQKKEKMLTIGVYSLIIVMTVVMMLIIFILFIKG